jgi:hypothetical protein
MLAAMASSRPIAFFESGGIISAEGAAPNTSKPIISLASSIDPLKKDSRDAPPAFHYRQIRIDPGAVP